VSFRRRIPAWHFFKAPVDVNRPIVAAELRDKLVQIDLCYCPGNSSYQFALSFQKLRGLLLRQRSHHGGDDFGSAGGFWKLQHGTRRPRKCCQETPIRQFGKIRACRGYYSMLALRRFFEPVQRSATPVEVASQLSGWINGHEDGIEIAGVFGKIESPQL